MTYLIYDKTSKEKRLNSIITDLQKQLQSMKDIKSYGIQPIDGLFEIHITVDPKDNYVPLLEFVKKYERMKGMKLVFAISRKGNNQYMISYFTNKKDNQLAIDSANKIAQELRESQIDVVRVKVESHNTKSFPLTDENYFDYKAYNEKFGIPYFEFHVKVNAHKILQDYLLHLEETCSYMKDKIDSKDVGIAVSYNICGQNKKPLLTIRIYNKGYLNAESYKNQILDGLKEKGYTFEDKLQQEFSVYDTNIELDKGWI